MLHNQYRLGVTRLTAADLLYQFCLLGLTSGWALALLTIGESQVAPHEHGELVIPVVLLWAIVARGAWASYSILIARRGIFWPRPFLLSYGSGLLVLLLLALWRPWSSVWVCLGAELAMTITRMLVAFYQPLWVGKSSEFLWHAGRVRRLYKMLFKRHEPRLYWAGMELPFGEGIRNFLLFGAISAGKTLSLRLYLQSFVPLIGKRPNLRVLAYDAKRDLVSILRGMNPDCPLHILSPQDARCSVWQIDRDVKTRSDARALATTLTPPKPARPGPGDFWVDATVYILEGLSLYFAHVVRENWQFRDILVACRSVERLLSILKAHPITEEYVYVLGSEGGARLSHSVVTTTLVYLSQFEPIASAWYHKRRHAKEHDLPLSLFSFENWVHEDAITILGRDVEHQTAMAALNRLFLTKAGRILLNQPGDDLNREPHHFFVLDEFHTLGVLPEFEELATTGSGRNVSLAIALQALPSLQRLYGHEGAEAILGQMYHRGFLRLNDTATAKFASEQIGSADRFLRTFKDGWWRQSTEIEHNVSVVPPEELRRIQPPVKGDTGVINWLLGKGGTPLKGYYLGNFGFWRRISPRYISKHLMPKADIPDVVPWEIPPLPTWDYDDIKRLKLESVIDPAAFNRQLTEEHQRAQSVAGELDNILQRLKATTSAGGGTPPASPD